MSQNADTDTDSDAGLPGTRRDASPRDSGARDGGARDASAAPPADASSALYREVQTIISGSCAIERCHKGSVAGAYLLLDGDLHAALVDRPACLYDRMDLVEPGEPEASWLWIKLTAPFRPLEDFWGTFIYFDPASDWDPSDRACAFEDEEGNPLFGSRMPLTAPNQLPDADLATIRTWIEQGAPR